MSYALNTVDQFAVRLNSIEHSNIKDLLYQCLTAASLQLLTDIRTAGFDVVVGQVDEFSLGKQVAFKDGRYLSLALKYGLVDTGTNAMVVVHGLDSEALDSATAIDPKFIRLDKEKGLVIIDMWGVSGDLSGIYRRNIPTNYYQYIFRVTYDCGLATSTTAEGKVYKNAPHWLSELSLLKAREVYQLTNPIINNEGKPLNAKQVSLNIQPILEANIRIFPLAVKPIL